MKCSPIKTGKAPYSNSNQAGLRFYYATKKIHPWKNE
jgi:hypothetical protein